MESDDGAPRRVTMSLETLRVQIVGIKAKPELNERVGVAIQFDEDKERYNVKLDGSGEVVSIKQSNLVKLDEIVSKPITTELRERKPKKKKSTGPPHTPSPEEILLAAKVKALIDDRYTLTTKIICPISARCPRILLVP